MYKKILFLMFIIVIICFAGCKSETNVDAADENNYITIINELGESEYTIVRSDYVDTYAKAALQFKKSAEALMNSGFKITTDWKDNPVEDKEIIIGKTLREGTFYDIDREDLGEEGFIIMVVDERLVIVGGNEVGTMNGVNYFFEHNTSEDGSLIIPKNYYYKYVQEYSVKMITINGNDIKEYKIVYGQRESSVVKKAAEELQKYINIATGKLIPIVTDNTAASDKEILVGKTNREDIDRDGLGSEGYVITFAGDKIIISGDGDRGTLYGVYDFLEVYIGWRFLTTDTEIVLESEHIILKNINDRKVPIFEFRDPYWTAYFEPTIAVKRKMNAHGIAELGGNFNFTGRFCHTMESLLGYPQDKQPCMSDPEIIQKTIDAVQLILDDYPDAKIISISQNDNVNYCKCEICKAVNAEEGTTGGTVFRYANAVADHFKDTYPELAFHTFAYQYSRKPPLITIPRDNVIIQLCSIECCFNHTLDDPNCEVNRTFKQDIDDWSKICNRIYIWDYTTNFAHYIATFPNFDVLRSNVRLFVDSNVKGIFEQGNYQGPSGEFGELRAYLLAKLLWDPYMSDEEYYHHMDEFLQGYYGKGWEYIRKFIDFNTEASAKKNHFYIYSHPYDIISAADIFNNIEMIDGWFAKAEEMADNDKILAHIQQSKLQYTYAKLNILFDSKYFGSDEDKEWIINENEAFKQELIRFNIRKSEGMGVPVNADTKKPTFDWWQ
ncbi:MAG: DUF4838 domain-containing protein [Oscillospiraceae bacterium]|nr:DUF4838 domain-containing protein [Oscillospiraceae bacterium]